MIIDSHTHYFLPNFDCGREQILNQLQENNFKVIETAIGYSSNEKVLHLCKNYPNLMWAVLGCHPTSVNAPGDALTEDRFSTIVKYIRNNPFVVGIGETGLEYQRVLNPTERKLQRYWFGRFIEAAKDLRKPLVIHCRGEGAYEDLYQILSEHKVQEDFDCPGVIHCFSGNETDAKRLEGLGFYFGIGGLFLRKGQESLRDVIRHIPVERFLLETDCPYLIPEGLPGKRNSSLNLPYIVGKLAELWECEEENVYQGALKNTKKVYSLT